MVPEELAPTIQDVSAPVLTPQFSDARRPLPTGRAMDVFEFQRAYVQYSQDVFGVAARVCGTDNAADVTQDVFIQLWRQPERFDPQRGTLRALLLTMARHRAIDLIRSGAARNARERQAAPPDVIQQEIGSGLFIEEHANRVVQALTKLPTKQRDAIVAAYFGQRSYCQAAYALGQPEGTLKARIRAGLAQLRAILNEGDLFPEHS